MSKEYLYRVSILSKKTSHPLDSIAHYCGQEQYDVLNNKRYSSNNVEQVLWHNIIVPDKHNLPELFYNLPDYLKFRSQKPDLIANARNILWKNVDSRESRANSQFARLFQISVPYFLNNEEAVDLVSSFAKVLNTEGMIVDCSIHSHNKKNSPLSIIEQFKFLHKKPEDIEIVENNQDYTAFLMCTLRDYQHGQFGNKNRDWNLKEKLKEWRAIWFHFLEMSISQSIDATPEDKKAWQKKLTVYPEYPIFNEPTRYNESIPHYTSLKKSI